MTRARTLGGSPDLGGGFECRRWGRWREPGVIRGIQFDIFMLNDILNKAKDVRTLSKMEEDIRINNYLGEIAMKALCDYLGASRHTEVSYKWYHDKMWTKLVGYKQDADLVIDGKTYPVEVKVTRFQFPFEIFIRKSSINSLPSNGRIFLCDGDSFVVLTKDQVLGFDIKPVSQWGNKLCYVIEKGCLNWIRLNKNIFS